MRVAMRRAAHQIFDDPMVFDDPLALRIAGEAAETIRAAADKHQSPFGKNMRAFLVARSRFAEEQLRLGIAEGVEQYVILGAGLDTSAYRGAAADSAVRVFEVDHPATQGWKKYRLAAAEISIPGNVQLVAVDFERQSLAEELAAAGFAAARKTFVSWLGVVPYLTQEAASNTLGYLGRLPTGSGVVFDYAVAKSALSWLERIALEALARRVAKAGEPFRLFFEPAELGEFLKEHGFKRIEQIGSTEINERYFRGRTDGLKVSGGVGRIVAAWR